MEYSKMTSVQMAEELCEVIRDGAASSSTVMHMIDEWKKDLQHHKDTTEGLWATDKNISDLLHLFFNSKSDANKWLEATQQEEMENDFREWANKITFQIT